MTYEIYRYIFIGGAILAGLMLFLAVLLFIILRIPTVIGDLTGSNARKAIKEIRNQNENSGDKTYKTSTVNKARGKVTDKITGSGRLVKNTTDVMGGAMATTRLDILQVAEETTLLDSFAGTNEPMPTASETTVLAAEPAGGGFEIESEITYIHTSEMIE